MNKFRLALSSILLVALSLPVFGGAFGTVTSVELKAMIDRNEPGMVTIDSRARSLYEETHIIGAISIPLAEMEQNQELPKVPKDSKLVFYCSGST